MLSFFIMKGEMEMNFKKSSLYSYNLASQTVQAGGSILFTNSSTTGCSIKQATTSNSQILNPGLYNVSVSATVASTETAGNISIQLYKDGVPVQGAISSADSTAATDLEAVSFSIPVVVNPNCCAVTNNLPTNLSVVVTGVAATVTNPIISIIKEA